MHGNHYDWTWHSTRAHGKGINCTVTSCSHARACTVVHGHARSCHGKSPVPRLKILMDFRTSSSASWARPSRRLYSISARWSKPYFVRKVWLSDDGKRRGSSSGCEEPKAPMRSQRRGNSSNSSFRQMVRYLRSFWRSLRRTLDSDAVGDAFPARRRIFFLTKMSKRKKKKIIKNILVIFKPEAIVDELGLTQPA